MEEPHQPVGSRGSRLASNLSLPAGMATWTVPGGPALFKHDSLRRIDRVIDYFGERPAKATLETTAAKDHQEPAT